MENSVTLVSRDDPSGEFPVLKAFQQYIDAEQAKANKRLFGFSLFFIALLIVVVVTFVLVLGAVINRNQALSDRLLDYAMKDKEQAQTIDRQRMVEMMQQTVKQPSPDEYLKPYVERLEKEQVALKAEYSRKTKEMEENAKKREAARDAELKKLREELESERLRIKKENDRLQEIERQRRRLYPEYYGEKPQQRAKPQPQQQYAAPAQQQVAPAPNPETIEEPEIQPEETGMPMEEPPSDELPSPAVDSNQSRVIPASLSGIKPITYFNDDSDGVSYLLEQNE